MLSRGFLDDFFEEQNNFMRAIRRHFDKELQTMSEKMQSDDVSIPKSLEQEKFVSKEVHSKTILDKDGNPITVEHVTHESKKIDKDGRRIQNITETYKNSEKGIERTSEIKRIGDKVMKINKEKIGDKVNIKEELENLEKSEIDDFEKEWKKLGGNLDHKSLGMFETSQKALK